ncbi:MAG: fibronectin type III domain-containing protein, partial [Bacteroidia bacterium]
MTDTTTSSITTIVIPDTVLSTVYYHQTSYLYPTKLSFPNLKKVTGYVYFHQTNNIVEIDFPQLKSTDAYFYVNGNISLQKVSAPSLDSITDYLYVRLNSALQVLDICNLTRINCGNQEPYFDISGNNTSVDSSQPCFNAVLNGTTLTTSPITTFSNNTAIAGGTFTHTCASPLNGYGVCWSTSPNPTTNNFTANGSGGTTFTANMTGLTPNTTYYVRAYYGNGVYGNEVSFTTLP